MKKYLAIGLSCWGLSLGASAAPANSLEAGFLNPPAAAKPWVYWFWLNGNLTEGGMTADLEAMARVGIGGVLIMEVDQGSPVGPVAFMSDRWRALFRHMVSEAARLGLEVNMNNDAGWNGSGGPWVPLDKAMQGVVTTATRIKGGTPFSGPLPQPAAKEGFYRDIAVLAYPTPAGLEDPKNKIENLPSKAMSWPRMHANSLPPEAPMPMPAASVAAKDRIIDLTGRMDDKGRLVWDAPASDGVGGEWTVIRFGHTFTGAKSHPAPATGAGPECDKLSAEGVETHYRGMIGKLVKDVGPLAGKVFAATHVDSWEVGAQNWTPKMREEFQRLRGYDLLPFLPVLTGQIVDSPEISERFLRDLRQTASDLLAENYIGRLRQLAHADGLRLSMEAYTMPANDQDVANHIDEPICEFWWPDGGGLYWTTKAMASVAHVNGLPVVGAEAFTATMVDRWLAHPATLKSLGDRAFCDGVNRMIFHRYAMQPWPEKRWPGMTMGPWGVHYERSNTWWEQSKEWHRYLQRCQYMLREGRFVADVLVLQSEEPMQRFTGLTLKGYDYDGISPQAFLNNAAVKDGRVVLPSGMSYRVLALPVGESMSPQMLEKIASLVAAGATVIGKPPSKAPGLSGYPQSDERVRALAARLWSGDRAIKDQAADVALAALGLAPDFESKPSLRYIHRTVGDKEVYFLANPSAQAVNALCTFRVMGKSPEAWDAESGRIEPLRVFEENGGRTRLPLYLDAAGSVFVVFQPVAPQPSERIVSIQHGGKELAEIAGLARERPLEDGGSALDLMSMNALRNGTFTIKTADGKSRQATVSGLPEPVEIAGPWEVKFDPANGGPAASVIFAELSDWSAHSDPNIKYYSGAATYRKRFSHPSAVGNHRTYLDLGQVAVMAEVTLNGSALGTLWKPPFRVDVSEVLKPGENSLELRVVSLPINRMIGDEMLPEDSDRNVQDKQGTTLKSWPRWLQEGKPSPTGRITFTTWRLWKKDDPLQPSGLCGPVTLQTVAPLAK